MLERLLPKAVKALVHALVLGLAVSHGAAASVLVTSASGVLNVASQIVGQGVSLGSEMVGMSVQVFYADDSDHTGFWQAGAGQSGSATVSDRFSLSVTGNTWSETWRFNNFSSLSIMRIVIDAGLGNAVFDRTHDGAYSTFDSYLGRDFESNTLAGDPTIDVVATYRDEVALFDPVTGVVDLVQGDLFRVLDIAFLNETGLVGGSIFQFRADTDNAPQGIAIAASEPAGMTLFALGLAAAVFGGRRRAAYA